MTDELDLLEWFKVFIQSAEAGAVIPPVSEDDLRHLHESCADMRKGNLNEGRAVSLHVLARSCSPGANVPAVWLRHTQLSVLIRQGVLADWQRNSGLDDAVYRVAATMPMTGLHFDQEAFIEQLLHKSAA
jgi:hypothetical protein